MFKLIYFRLYLAFVLNVFYVLYFNLFTLSLIIILSDALSSIYGAIGVEHVRVGHIANLCVTHSRMMHLIWTCEIRGSWIIQRILDSLRMTTVVCYLVFVLCVFHSWFRQCNPIILWHTDIRCAIGEQRSYAAEIMNRRYIRQTPDNTRQPLFLGGFITYPS
jgi:hypothetical protein